MSKKISLLALLILTLLVVATATYFYLDNQQTEQAIEKQDTTSCTTDNDCGWYDITAESGRAQKCANSNIVLAENATPNSIAPSNTLCLCMVNKCDTTTFTVSED